MDFKPSKKLGFGLMRLPLTDPNVDTSIDIEQLKQMVDAFLAGGFTYFDTAWMYCGFKSECAVKDALVSRHPRDSFTLADKLHAGFLKPKRTATASLTSSAARPASSILTITCCTTSAPTTTRSTPSWTALPGCREKKAQGLVRHIGFSFHDNAELLDRVLTEHPEVEFVQLQLNYLDWDSEGVQSRKCYETAVKHGKPVIVMEPVKGGTLAQVPEAVETMFRAHHPDLSVPSWAIRFAASLDNVMVVLSGMSTLAQVQDNMSYMAQLRPLDAAEQALVKKAVDIINGAITIPCTGCSYCTDGCPRHIAIPKYFSLYNAELQEVEGKGWTPQGEYYDRLTLSFGKASDCIGCGQCERVCPQHLPIIRYLKDVAAKFGK